jgi:hypothetical protein
VVWISLEPHNDKAPGDLDLFLIRQTPTGGLQLVQFAASNTSHELLGVALGPGTWFVGVGAFDGSVRYELRVMQNVQ